MHETALEQRDSLRFRQLLMAWSGPLFVAMFFVGLVAFMDFVPPPSPMNTGAQTVAVYTHDLTRMRIGIVICSLAVAMMASWGASVAVRCRRTEGDFPVYTYVQLACIGVGTMVGVLAFLFYAVAAFRPDDVAPETTRMLNDIGWYFFLFDVSPFMVWMIVVGLAVLSNRSGRRFFPRWVGYVSLGAAVGELPAVLILFFKRGPFAYDGVIGFWLPTIAFFAWVMVLTYAVIKDVNAEGAELNAKPDASPIPASTIPAR